MEDAHSSGKSYFCRRISGNQDWLRAGVCIHDRALSLAGYVSSTNGNIVQPESAVAMIQKIYMYGPFLVLSVVIVTLVLYRLDKRYPDIMKELCRREASGFL